MTVEEGTAEVPGGSPPGGEPDGPRSRLRWFALALFAAVLAAGVAALFGLAAVGGRYRPVVAAGSATAPGPQPDLEERRQRAERRLGRVAPRGRWVVVDSWGNRLRVFRDGALEREAPCSTGSGLALRDPRNGRLWVFETPLGERRVQRKTTNPVWNKPDWAFIEEGWLPPPAGSPDRADTFSLGDFALYLGDGYLIHGTIFQTLLGRRVTHGCIRLGDAELEWVYRRVPLGARVYLY